MKPEWYLCSILEVCEEIAAANGKTLLGISVNGNRGEGYQYFNGGVMMGILRTCHDACPYPCPPTSNLGEPCDCC